MSTSIFDKARRQQELSEIEFRFFRSRIKSELAKIIPTIARFDEVRREYQFWVGDAWGEDHIQLTFGKRKVGVEDFNGQPVIESGPKLVYTIGRTGGLILTTLFPAHSELGTPTEDHIFIRIGHFSGLQLIDSLADDLNTLVSYAFVTSLETRPTIRDRLRIWFLKSTRPHQVGGEIQHPISPTKFLTGAFSFALAQAFVAVLKPLAYIAVAVALLYFGQDKVVELLKIK